MKYWILNILFLILTHAQMSAEIKWGILSTARFNDKIIEVIKLSKHSEVQAVASRSIERAQEYAKNRGIPTAYGSYEELLEDPELDVIYIPLPNSLHAEWTVKALEAGKHVLCEKPLALSLQEMADIEEAARKNNKIVFEGFAYFFHPQTIELMKILKENKIGNIQFIQSSFHIDLSLLFRNGVPVPNSEQIRLNPDLGGGCLWDIGAYCSSLSILIAQAGEPTEVWAHAIKGPTGVDIMTTAHMKFANGALAQFSLSFYSPYSTKMTIFGSKGIISLDAPWRPGLWKENSITFVSEFEPDEKVFFPKGNPFVYEIEAMENAVMYGIKPAMSLDLSKSFLRTLLALKESSESGKVVKLL